MTELQRNFEAATEALRTVMATHGVEIKVGDIDPDQYEIQGEYLSLYISFGPPRPELKPLVKRLCDGGARPGSTAGLTLGGGVVDVTAKALKLAEIMGK